MNDEPDGIELQLYQANSIKLPGIDGRFTYIYLMRNHFEEGQKLDNDLPEKYTIKYNAEYFSTENGGYKRVEEEASLYHSFIDYQPSDEENITGDEETEEYSLTVYTHLPLTHILKILSSRAVLNNAHVRVELYLDNSLRGFVTSSRLAFSEDYWVDWSNSTIFRKAVFPNLEPGFYVVKIFLENILGNGKEFIGYTYLDLKEDTTTHLICKSESKLKLNVVDENGTGIEGVEAFILNEGTIISKVTSDENGLISTGVPCCRSEGYELRLVYKGFLLTEEKIDLSIKNIIFPFRKDFTFSLYDFKLDIEDYQEKTLDFDIDVSLTSEDMFDQIFIKPDSSFRGTYDFENLPSSDYDLILAYDSLEIKEKISIPEMSSKEVLLYDFTINMKDSWNLTPSGEIEAALTSLDLESPVTIRGDCDSNGKCIFSHLYAGNYRLKIFYKSFTLEKNINVPGDDGLEETLILPFVFNVSTLIFENTGGPLFGVKVTLSRNGEEKTVETNETGSAMFSIPAGGYAVEVYDGDNIIGKRKIEVLNDKNIDLVTNQTSLLLIISIAVLSIFLIIASVFCIRRKDYRLWLKFFIVFVLLLSLFLPWWSISGISEEPYYETSTNLYLTTSEMVTFTQNKDVYAGELSTLDELFIFAINTLTLFISLSVACVLFSIFLKHYTKKKRISIFVLFISLVLLISCLTVFIYSMFEFSNSTVGSIFGSGDLDIDIPGENMYIAIPCVWGPNIGFYLFLFSTILTTLVIFFENKKNK
jgi:hypothetical protein